jgi:hypothetical protein
MYVGTVWNLKRDDKPRETYYSPLGNLLVKGERGVVIGARGMKKVKVSAMGNVVRIIAEDTKTYTGGHMMKEWLNGKENDALVQMEEK